MTKLEFDKRKPAIRTSVLKQITETPLPSRHLSHTNPNLIVLGSTLGNYTTHQIYLQTDTGTWRIARLPLTLDGACFTPTNTIMLREFLTTDEILSDIMTTLMNY